MITSSEHNNRHKGSIQYKILAKILCCFLWGLYISNLCLYRENAVFFIVADRDYLHLPQWILNAVFPGHLKVSNFGYKTYSILKLETIGKWSQNVIGEIWMHVECCASAVINFGVSNYLISQTKGDNIPIFLQHRAWNIISWWTLLQNGSVVWGIPTSTLST
jgi:hypothetical protein